MGSNTVALSGAALAAEFALNARDLLTAGVVIIGVIALLLLRPRLAGTTLQAPWVWLVASLVCVGACDLAVELHEAPWQLSWSEPLRFVAATSLFCPVMAVLGAKRPQNRAWQFVVVSLWGVLILPAVKHVFLEPDTTFELHPARSWFLLLLILVGLMNFLPTRFWPSAILFAGGQTLLLGQHLPFGGDWFAAQRLAGVSLIVATILLIVSRLPRRRRAASPLDQTWLDFRDSFGALWALRVADRINAAARMNDWDLCLKWNGFQFSNDEDAVEELSPAQLTSLNNLLRRFVSREWIASRLGDGVD